MATLVGNNAEAGGPNSSTGFSRKAACPQRCSHECLQKLVVKEADAEGSCLKGGSSTHGKENQRKNLECGVSGGVGSLQRSD